MSKEDSILINVKSEFWDFFRPLFWIFFRRFWYVLILLVLFSVFSLKELFYGKSGVANFFNFLPLILIFILIWSIYSTAKRFTKATEGNISYAFSEAGVDVVSYDSESKIKWSFFEKADETKNDFLLFQNKTRFHPIPKRFFQNETQIQEFKNLVREKLGDKAKLK